ncbi:hypothetical protein OS190_06815 [Sulfitobacter sp. F26204]|uniref:hypothetical protein n=1 Tax=Sulfitobacter sp. F26204 TaxID=2996014 RepID=UPI00225DD8F3|nr:hypothetical protein [Sulfitobacter sp. F26204]MCX7559276.1 hypothetical protein [Sulfitobacter sp. F26204]
MMRTTFLCTLLALPPAGCTQFPELEHTQNGPVAQAEYPALVPLDPLLARAATPGADPAGEQAELFRRIAGLRQRADMMRGSVLTGPEKQRLQQGLH